MKPSKYIFLFFLLITFSGYSQFKVWQLTSYSAQIGLRGTYRESVSKSNGLKVSKQSGGLFNGNLNVRTKSYFVHPNFMEVTLNGNYSPYLSQEFYIAAPDYSEKSNIESVDFSAFFLKRKNINLSVNANIVNSLVNIENMTRMKGQGKSIGAGVNYFNKILPFNINYSQDKSKSEIIGSNRIFFSENSMFQGNAYRSFTSHDENTFYYAHSTFKTIQKDDYVGSLSSFSNNDNLAYSNGFYFDKAKKYNLASSVSYSYRLGSNPYSNLGGSEILNMKLPKNFYFTNGYNWAINKQGPDKVYNKGIQSSLDHKLFESLTSKFSFLYNEISQTNYNQQSNKFALNLNYTKKITNGRLTLAYNYNKEYQRVKTPPVLQTIVHEGYKLIDGQIVLLINQNINIQSVIVRDSTGGIIYLPNIDYILVDKSPFLEIIRVPGGMIPNGGSVYIDYIVTRPGLYKFNGQGNGFSATIGLLNNKLTVYYSLSWQRYNNVTKTENLLLNYTTSQVVGVRLDFYVIKGGVEYQYHESTLLPYRGMRYYINFQKMYTNFNITINGNIQDLAMEDESKRRQNYDVTLALAYRIFGNINLHLDYMYRKMIGQGFEIDAHTSKFMVSGSFHRLSASIGGQMYLNKQLKSSTSYKGIFLQLTRKF